jgi:Cof subfamily protein (haloacid dehalogenase superfamily)
MRNGDTEEQHVDSLMQGALFEGERITVLALDLDDTLLRSDSSLAPGTADLLVEWRDRGNQIVIATGRPPRSTGESLSHELHGVPWICYNGAEIRQNGETVYRDLLSIDDTRRIVESLQAGMPDLAVGLEINDVLYMNRDWERPYPYEVADLAEVATSPVAKILFFHGDIHNLNGLFDDLPNSAQVMISEKYRLVQVMSRTADKAHALRHLVQMWGQSMENVMAFGDDVNDVKMVEQSGVGIAVENAVPEVKAVADRITLSNDDDGVGVVLREILKKDANSVESGTR